MTSVLVTGANGFIGSQVVRGFLHLGFEVRAAIRQGDLLEEAGHACCRYFTVGDIAISPNWNNALAGVDAVVHLAARVHQLRDRASDPLAEFREVNTAATEQLTRAAARAGVRRLVYVNSVKVNGETTRDRPFFVDDPPNPQDSYAVSKWEAEQALWAIGAETGIEVVVARPPLVYGPCVRANFLRMMDLVYMGLPLPVANAHNRRSLIGVRNLADFLVQCVRHPRAANETFLVSDDDDVSVAELVTRIARHMGRPRRMFPLPETVMWQLSKLLRKQETVRRLLGSLTVDCARTRQILGWQPPLTLDEGLGETVRWYLEFRAKRRGALRNARWFQLY